jgi:hypothetical protein
MVAVHLAVVVVEALTTLEHRQPMAARAHFE